ncbi:MAG TPA: phenylalanine--tRNA ligase subunit alpha [Saprospiraceae bacterium]|nr:phenylalanine--tRNA ligase subunit alpha [Saprospiraceae bacterium]
MQSEVNEELDNLLSEIEATQPTDANALEVFRLRFLGSKNILKPFFAEMSKVTGDARRMYGQKLNSVKTAAEEKYTAIKEHLEKSTSAIRSDSAFDLTLPPDSFTLGSRHPVSIVMREITAIFARIGFVVAEEREIEDDWHNFTSMNTPEDHPARDMQDTFYLKGSKDLLLRTHTSSVQARVMTTQKPPIRIIAPGRVYRNETISARSHCQFHQVEGLYVDEGVSFADMKQTLYYYARSIYGEDVKIRLRPSYFPFTEPSAEMDVYWGLKDETDYRITKGTGWLEIMGCGMVDPAVLQNCGIDPDRYSGFAFGMGIERQAMLKYRVGDIRMFFENDVRFLRQFRSVSML